MLTSDCPLLSKLTRTLPRQLKYISMLGNSMHAACAFAAAAILMATTELLPEPQTNQKELPLRSSSSVTTQSLSEARLRAKYQEWVHNAGG